MSDKNRLETMEEEQEELDRRDAAFRARWEKEQEAGHPALYAATAHLRAVAEDEGDEPASPLGLEPGHDVTRDEKLSRREAAAQEEGAGGDNLPPHETTPAAATSQPAPPIVPAAGSATKVPAKPATTK